MSRPSLLAPTSALARGVSIALGHSIGEWERAGLREVVARCSECNYFAVVDTNGGPVMYGAAVQVVCQGELTTPAWAPERISSAA